MISPEDNAKTMPPVQGAVWVEPYERNGVTVSGYWRGPNGRRIEYADTNSEWKSRDFYLNKKLDDPNTTVINTIYNNTPFNLRNPYEAVSNFQDYASVLDNVIETDVVPGEAERGRELMEELANAYHAVSWDEVNEYAFKAGVRPEPGNDQARLLTYYPDNGEMVFANVYWPLEVQPNGEKTYAKVDRPEAVHSSNPTPVDYRAFVDPAWYPAQKAAFQHIDEFLRNSDDYSIREMIQDFR